MVEAIVDFDYDAQEPDELTIRKGDVLQNIIMKPGGWWEGTLNDKRGMFPDNFVHVLESEVVIRNKTKEKRLCRAIFSYAPEHDDELQLNVGDVIEVLGEIEEGWWKGKLNDKEGVFPSNFVEELPVVPVPLSTTITSSSTSSSHPLQQSKKTKNLSSKEDLTNLSGSENDTGGAHVPSLPPKPVRIMCQAMYAYKAQNDDELTLKVGDLITLISKDGQDKGWWRGELRGRIGVFPDNFVNVITVPVDQSTNASAPPLSAAKKPTDRPQIAKINPMQQPFSNIGKKETTPPSSKLTTTTSTTTSSSTVINTTVALQRKSLEAKVEGPPIPGKKPNIPIKKSPSLTGGGLLSGLKQKVLGHDHKSTSDTADGGCTSRIQAAKDEATTVNAPEEKQDEFDQVERSSMLSDPRANRAKAPGRRPPSMVFRENDSGLMNGNVDHPPTTLSSSPTANDHSENEIIECKPKPRDWEKHRAPWMDELKLNQAKKTSPLNPSPESVTNRLRFTSSSERLKLSNEKIHETITNDDSEPSAKTRTSFSESSADNMSKSMSAAIRLRTPTPETPEPTKSTSGVVFRNRTSLTNQSMTSTPPVRPQSIHATTTPPSTTSSTNNSENNNNKVSPSMLRNQTPSPVLKPPIGVQSSVDRKPSDTSSSAATSATVSLKQYNELEEKFRQLELAFEKQTQLFNSKFDELSQKLQTEIQLRQQLKSEVDKLAQCVTQV